VTNLVGFRVEWLGNGANFKENETDLIFLTGSITYDAKKFPVFSGAGIFGTSLAL